MKRAILSLSLVYALFGAFFAAPAVTSLIPHTTAYAQEPQAGEVICKGSDADKCKSCFDDGGAWTAVGCIGRGGEPGDFIQWMISLGTGVGGGIAFLLILVSGFQTIVSAGNPEKLHAAKELMTAAISGLLLIIFSVLLLKIIGIDILQIPGL